MSRDTEEWCKVYRKADLLFQKWQEFGELWPEHTKVSKLCTLIGSFCAKYITLDLKKYRRVIFWFRKWHEEFVKFSPEHLKVSKLGLWWDSFIQSRKCMGLKFTEELCVIAMKNDTLNNDIWRGIYLSF